MGERSEHRGQLSDLPGHGGFFHTRGCMWRTLVGIRKNGISDNDFRVRLAVSDIRVLHHDYQLEGAPCSQDPPGQIRVMGIPHSIGRSVVITDEDGLRTRSRHSHVPFPSLNVFRGLKVRWPLVSPEQRTVSTGERVAILGWNPTLGLADSLDHFGDELTMGSYYPRAIARQALWAARRHYDSGHFRHFLHRAGGVKGVGKPAL